MVLMTRERQETTISSHYVLPIYRTEIGALASSGISDNKDYFSKY